MDGTIERIPIEIPGVKVVGDFPIKRFKEAIYNGAVRQYGAKLNVTIMPPADTAIGQTMGRNTQKEGRITSGK